MQDYFVFKDFLCIVFECLSKSLYDVILPTEKGLPLDMVRDYLRQILEALITFKESELIHCDLKPENIMVDEDLKTLKLIDFGSAAFNGHQVYTYIQSRYYRAPEVLMGCFKEN
jgi:dual specificity protein kinase YAK1